MKVTIEGSRTTPSAHLAAGKRAVVERTKFINVLIKRGYVFVVPDVTTATPTVPAPVVVEPAVEAELTEPEQEADEQAEQARQDLEVPSRGGSRAEWAEFLTSQGVPFQEEATRGDLIQAWEASEGTDG